MAEAGTAAQTINAGQALGGFQQRFAALSGGRKVLLMAVGAALVAALIGGMLWSREPSYRLLFTNIPDKDAGAVVQSLQQMNIPYKLDAGGISVPADKIYDARLRLAAQGLPKAGNVGFELLDNQKFGVSQFTEQVNYQRAVEGELARSIESISAVEKARVHLAIPKQSVFLRDQQKPTASVILTLHSGRLLDDAQVAGILHLVSSSIPELQVKNVSIVDQDGNLLSNNNRINQANLDQKQLQYIALIERGYVERVQAILAPLVGKDNVRAEVTAQVDFAEVEQTSETYRPNSPPNAAAIRSQQTLDQQGRSTDPGAMGVPGALSNQPPGAATAPITAPVGSEVASASGASGNSRREATTNYEVDKTVQHVKQPVGSVKRLSAAVVLNFKPGKNKDGKPDYVPFTAQEMAQINNLVREAIGYNQSRGDSVNVVNAAFADARSLEDKPVVEKATDYLQTNWPSVLKALLLAIAVIYLLFFIVRPLMKDITRKPEAKPLQLDLGEGMGSLTADNGEDGEGGGRSSEEDQAQMAAFADLLQQAKELAKNDPRMVATILREWMNEDEGKNDNPNKVG
ncbi:flagellar basal-body MS-ring/collar protein FliF [Chitinilyticum piscinae]|uniref:Flagellar M-ring protein n=1 Tax=Chitinilyticum piscinae TaxID=2866724 RepID=A0A8J7FG73_9NEIS|nr:flagellar basal-body MS-ring/collar protein FliF [Chitinilyticum piscinae]MBE9608808.1 flagellar M-ring protein FliF [Chitinilyticum piscinae]